MFIKQLLYAGHSAWSCGCRCLRRGLCPQEALLFLVSLPLHTIHHQKLEASSSSLARFGRGRTGPYFCFHSQLFEFTQKQQSTRILAAFLMSTQVKHSAVSHQSPLELTTMITLLQDVMFSTIFWIKYSLYRLCLFAFSYWWPCCLSDTIWTFRLFSRAVPHISSCYYYYPTVSPPKPSMPTFVA